MDETRACPGEQTLRDFGTGGLTPEQDESIRAHLASCETCTRHLAHLALGSRSDAEGQKTSELSHSSPSAPSGFRGGSSSGSDEAELKPGTIVGRYVVLEKLGEGGMGMVYAAYDQELDRKVALKLLLPMSGEEGSAGQGRLLREAQALARIAHPNVVSVFDVGVALARVYVAMEFVEGQTLKEWSRASSRTWREVVQVMSAAGRGLVAAHAAGLVHRDFKPDNVLVGKDGRVRVLDFGVARAAGNRDPSASGRPNQGDVKAIDVNLTQAGRVVGTPAYMAPEHLRGHTDALTDQYSFCLTLYELLYKERPFAGSTIPERAANAEAMRLRELPERSNVPAWLRRIVLRGIQPKPEQRYRSMEALLTDLSYDPAVTRRRWLSAGAALAVIAAAVGITSQLRARTAGLCSGAEAQLAGVWDAQRRGAIQAAFLATGVPFSQDAWKGVQKALDGYTRQWVRQRTEACEATRLRGEQSEEVLDLRMACLDRRLKDVSALGTLFTHADRAVVTRAVKSATELDDLNACADVEALKAPVPLPTDRKQRARLEALETRLSEAKALVSAGKYAEVIPLAEKLSVDARSLGYRPFEAEVLLQLGVSQAQGNETAKSEPTMQAAWWSAEAGRHDRLKAQILAAYGGVVLPLVLGRVDDGLRVLHDAEAVVERVGDEEMRARVLANKGSLLTLKGQPMEGRPLQLKALEILERKFGPDHPFVARVVSDIGVSYGMESKHAEALPYYERAKGILERAFGPSHPDLGVVSTNIASAQVTLGAFSKALAEQEHGLVLEEKARGKGHPYVALSYLNLGSILYRMRRFDESGKALGGIL